MRLNVPIRKIGPDQPDAAVDVVTHPAGRNDPAFIRIGRADSADAEAVAPVDIRHGQAGVLNTGQKGDIGHLVGGLVLLELVEQALVGVNQAVHAHALLVAPGNAPAAFIDLLQRAAIAIIGHDGLPTL